jgi:hypothetical protein
VDAVVTQIPTPFNRAHRSLFMCGPEGIECDDCGRAYPVEIPLDIHAARALAEFEGWVCDRRGDFCGSCATKRMDPK